MDCVLDKRNRKDGIQETIEMERQRKDAEHVRRVAEAQLEERKLKAETTDAECV